MYWALETDSIDIRKYRFLSHQTMRWLNDPTGLTIYDYYLIIIFHTRFKGLDYNVNRYSGGF